MKMRSRLLTVILSAAMVLSMTSPVLAEEGAVDSTTAVTQETEKNIKESVSSDTDTVSSEPTVTPTPDTAEQPQASASVSSSETSKEVTPNFDTQTENKSTQNPDNEAANSTDAEITIEKTQETNTNTDVGNKKNDKEADSPEAPVVSAVLQEKEEAESWTVDNHVKMFKVDSAVTSGTGSSRTLTVTLSSTGYNYLYLGSKAEADAAPEASWIQGTEVSGQYSFSLPVSTSETVIPISARSVSKNKWYGRQFTLDWGSKKLTVDNEPEVKKTVSVTFSVQNDDGMAVIDGKITVTGSDGKTVSAGADGSYTLTVGASYTVKASADGYADGVMPYQAKDGETNAVIKLGAISNNVHTDVLSGTDLADGEYTNVKTQKSGGLHDTTELTISKVTVSGGKASAEITWKSKNKATHFLLGYLDVKQDDSSLYNPETQTIGSAYTDYCFTTASKQDGNFYYSTATIPVQLGSAFVLSVRYPDAMSKPYWSRYSVTIQADSGEKATQKVWFQATDTDGKNINGAVITVTGSDGNNVKPDADGGYTLYRDASYHLAAAADGYYSASQDYTVTGDASVMLKLTRKEAGTFELTVKNNLNMFKVVSASITGSGANRTLIIALSGQGYHYLFKGNTRAASVSKTSDRIKYQVNSSGLYEFRIPVSTSDGTFDLSALSAREQKWYSRQLTLDWNNKSLTVGKGSGETLADQKPADFSDNANNTAKNNSSEKEAGKGATSVSSTANGYTFRWSGGSGRAIITCLRIFEQNGQLYATIHFSRENGGASAYTQVRSLGQTVSGNNTFTIPVNKNANTTIQALTTAMSAPHWITYTIYVGEGGSTENSLTANTKQLDEKAPEITGLTVKGEVNITYSDKIKIFEYENNIYLREVNMVEDTARKEDDDQAGSKTVAKQTETESVSEETADSGDGEDKIYADNSVNTKDSDVYSNDIVKYLVVPEGQEVPAGLDKDVVIIQQPTDKTYVTSEEALQILTDLDKTEDIKAVGLEEKEIQDDAVKAAMNKNDGEDGKIYQAGSYDKWDLKTLIKQEANFAIESSEILPQEEKTADEDMKSFEKLASQAVQMDMAMFVDRSADEKNDLAKAEWYKVYGIIFDAQDKAEELYKKVTDSASEQEKKEAVEELTAEKSVKK